VINMPKDPKKVNPLNAVGRPMSKEEIAETFAPDSEETQEPALASTPPPEQITAPGPAAPPAQPAEEPWIPLYKTSPSAVWLDKSFNDRYAKGGAVFDPYLIGAIETIALVEDRKIYKIWQEMMRDFIAKHEESLQSPEAQKLLRKKEQSYREKYHERE
jgi:hypothetical protein